jgi:Uma2 family endonuclease
MRARVSAQGTGFGPYTVLDLHALDEDGKGHELEDGWLIEVAAGPRHNWALQNLAEILRDAAKAAGSPVVVCQGGEWEISTPAGVRKPDIFVISRDIAKASVLDESPKIIPGSELFLAVEVISPGSGSERTDRIRKVMEYAGLGIPQYWMVEHTPHLSVQVLRLDGAGYVADTLTSEGTLVAATIDADKPFSVSFDPADLLAF